MIKKYIKSRLISVLSDFSCLEGLAVDLRDYHELMKLFNWQDEPTLNLPELFEFKAEVDLNERRIRDAECLGVVMKNYKPKVAVEIGTASGLGTALMSINSPESKIYTINIPPEEIKSGKGGKFTTIAINKNEIGKEFRKRNLENIEQIFVNTANWEPNIGEINLVFIDGCHDSEFVYNDTRKCLKCMKPGAFILWHDFNLGLVKKYNWINSVCRGVEKLCQENIIRGRIYCIKDSWIGIYKIPEL